MSTLGTHCAVAEPVTAERIDALPAADKAAWQEYVARLQAAAKMDQAALDAEVAANGGAAKKTPSGGDYKLSPSPATPGSPAPRPSSRPT